MDHDQLADEIRSPAQVANRALALFSVVGLAMGADRSDIMEWLTEHDLWKELAPSEAGFIDTPAPSRKQKINAGWLSERLIVIMWALVALDGLPPPDEQCDTSVFRELLPPFSSASVSDFVATARLRPPTELVAMANELLMLHWEARDARIKGRPPKQRVDTEIIQERHHAINWLIGYVGLDCDEVTTDT